MMERDGEGQVMGGGGHDGDRDRVTTLISQSNSQGHSEFLVGVLLCTEQAI